MTRWVSVIKKKKISQKKIVHLGFVLYPFVATSCGPHYDGKYISRHASPPILVDLEKEQVICGGPVNEQTFQGDFDLEGDTKSMRIRMFFFSCSPTEPALYYRLKFSQSTNCKDRPLALSVFYGNKVEDLDAADTCRL